jgi:amino acid transporter
VAGRERLARILGLGFGIAVIFGGTVGVGILRLPGTIAGQVPNAWVILLVWALGGLYALLGAVQVAELGAAIPEAGGFYVYAKRAFGPATGFAMGWADWLNNCAWWRMGRWLRRSIWRRCGRGLLESRRDWRWRCWRFFVGCTGLGCG